MRLQAKLVALERARPSASPPWETVVVDQAAGETCEAAMARQFGSDGAPPAARLIVVTIGEVHE